VCVFRPGAGVLAGCRAVHVAWRAAGCVWAEGPPVGSHFCAWCDGARTAGCLRCCLELLCGEPGEGEGVLWEVVDEGGCGVHVESEVVLLRCWCCCAVPACEVAECGVWALCELLERGEGLCARCVGDDLGEDDCLLCCEWGEQQHGLCLWEEGLLQLQIAVAL